MAKAFETLDDNSQNAKTADGNQIQINRRNNGSARCQSKGARNSDRVRKRPRTLAPGVRLPKNLEDIEVFDFEKKWELAKPFLHDPEIEEALEHVMNCYLANQLQAAVTTGIDGERWRTKYDPSKGPWNYTDCDCWHRHAWEQANAVIASGEFQWQCGNDKVLAESFQARLDGLIKRFYPQPDTFQWYQLISGCYWLAPWLGLLGARMFPNLEWSVVKGPHHSFAVGVNKKSEAKIIFDIVGFRGRSAEELISITRDSCCE